MQNGVFALLGRSLRIDARSWLVHLTRLGLIGAIYFDLCVTLMSQDLIGAPGLRFFEGIAYLDVVIMTLLGIGFFSIPITEEKEEDTLGLMLMAGISPLGILAGKSGGQIWQALLLLAVQVPTMMLAVTMGGITSVQIVAVTIALLAYMILLAGFGLFCSTLASNSRRAGGWMIVGISVYYLVPLIARTAAWFYNRWIVAGGQDSSTSKAIWNFVEGLGNTCVFDRLSALLSTGFGQSACSVQVLCNGFGGMLFAALSWLMFGVATRNPSTEAASRGLIASQRGFFRFHAGRPQVNPFLWKDFHFVSGGIGMILVRVVYYGGLASIAGIYLYVAGSLRSEEWFATCLLWMSFSIAVDAGMMLARSLQAEVRGQTLASLKMLPQSTAAIFYLKFAGALLGWLPGPIIGLAFTLSTTIGRRDLWQFWKDDGLFLILVFVLIPHLAAFISLYVRWGAVPLAICATIAIMFILLEFSELLSSIFNPRFPGTLVRLATSFDQMMFAFLELVVVGICAACHVGVLLRVNVLGSK